MSDLRLTGRVALITGAGRGIGREIARWLSAAGADIAVCARSREGIAALADEVRAEGGRVLGQTCDVSDPSEVSEFIDHVLGEFGACDIVVANAAVLGPVGTIDRVDPSEWCRTLAVNVCGTAAVIRAALPSMAARGYGRILTLSGGGVGGPTPPDRVSAYVASKGAVMLLTEVLAKELPEGVTINSIAPGAVPTGFMDEVLSAGRDVAGSDLYDAVLGQTTPDLGPLRDLVLYLADEHAGWLNGRCLSARWDPPGALRALERATVSPSRFRLRRIDEDLYSDRKETGR